MLSVALERYSAICLAIHNLYACGHKPHAVNPQLLPRLDAEIDLATSLQSELSRAKAALSWSRNYSHTHVTVNDIPSEVLASIFHLVLSSQPCAKRDYREFDEMIDPVHPAVLSRVCSRWRSIAFSTPTLWTHIDISTSTLLNKQHFYYLTKLHLSHVGQSSLDLHLFDASGYENNQFSLSKAIPSITGSITRLAGRTSSFNMDELYAADTKHGIKILSTFFQESIPETLTDLTLSSNYLNRIHRGQGFLKAKDDPGHDGYGLTIDIPKGQLESILSHVSVLRLAGPYLRWNSRAYYGLVELRLAGREVINESVLVGILRSSPGLRILQLGLRIDSLLSIDSQVTPVELRDLEVLIVRGVTCTLLP
ncbi:putative F-box-like domain protein, partial [Rhizoctonia solani 123E]